MLVALRSEAVYVAAMGAVDGGPESVGEFRVVEGLQRERFRDSEFIVEILFANSGKGLA